MWVVHSRLRPPAFVLGRREIRPTARTATPRGQHPFALGRRVGAAGAQAGVTADHGQEALAGRPLVLHDGRRRPRGVAAIVGPAVAHKDLSDVIEGV
jgi:hypothetical protein